ncbi:MAG: hypothetical protein AAF494_01860 [Pseudomonadota bacterium]
MRGEITSGKKSKRHPLDWCVDEHWCAEQLAIALNEFGFEWEADLAVWDPSCGMGNTLQAAWQRGIRTYGSDLVDNFAWSEFEGLPALPQPKHFIADFLETEEAPDDCSIVCNPPYSYIDGIAERFVRHALKLATKHVCMLLPVKWLAPGVDQKEWSNRSSLFRKEHPPLAIMPMSQRPSMPPGDMIGALGSRAFKGGMVDYCWIVWDVSRPTATNETRVLWLPPLIKNHEIQPLEEAK